MVVIRGFIEVDASDDKGVCRWGPVLIAVHTISAVYTSFSPGSFISTTSGATYHVRHEYQQVRGMIAAALGEEEFPLPAPPPPPPPPIQGV